MDGAEDDLFSTQGPDVANATDAAIEQVRQFCHAHVLTRNCSCFLKGRGKMLKSHVLKSLFSQTLPYPKLSDVS